MGLSIFDPKLG